MKWISRAFSIHLALGIAALAAGLALNGLYVPAAAAVLMGIYWYLAQVQRRYGFETTLLLVSLLTVALGFYHFVLDATAKTQYEFPLWLALMVAVPLMGAWDLGFFMRRLRSVDKVMNESSLGRIHLARLFMAEGVGLVLGVMAQMVHTSIPLWLAILLVFAAVIGVSQVVLYVRRQME